MDTTLSTLWRAEHVAKLLDIPPHRLYALVRAGDIPHVRIHRRVRFVPAQIERWFLEGGTAKAKTDDAA